MEIKELVKKQREFYNTHITDDVNYRIEKLKKLKSVIKEKQDDICEALRKDLGKSSVESYMAEIGMVLEDLSYIIRNTKKWSKRKYVSTPIAQFPARSFRQATSYGIVLIISPWNYPFLLTMQPLVGAICAGNCAIVKPSEFSVNTSNIIKEIIEQTFEEKYVSVVLGEKEAVEELLEERMDYIFYTGSTRVGKIIMEGATKNLTPVTLELGGKSPCIVDKKSNYKLAAKRIMFGKILNCGQTCVAPDYIFVHKDIKKEFIEYLEQYIKKFLGENPLENEEYPKMINEKQFRRMIEIIEDAKNVEKDKRQENKENRKNEQKGAVVFGSKYDEKTLKIEPTIITIANKNMKSKAMQEEIFGPILPVIEYSDIDEVIEYINVNEKPLALYLFTTDKKLEKRILSQVAFGGGCINDTIIHLATTKMPFGGVGYSGMGAYHGKFSFDTFSHYKSIVKKSNLIDLPMRYHPYTKLNDTLIKMFMK